MPSYLAGRLFISFVQNTKVSETQEFRKSYYITAPERYLLDTITVPIMCYRGESINSEQWMDKEKCKISCYFSIFKQTQYRTCAAMYSTLCQIKGDTTELCKSLRPQVGMATFYEIGVEVVLSLGLTELKAHICWEENVSNRTN
jgi:hypothetical protein